MADILDEIKEDLKYERYAYLWKKYGTVIIGIPVVIVLVTAINVWYQQHQRTLSYHQGSQLFKAAQYEGAGNLTESQKLYQDIIAGKASNVAAIAAVHQAIALAKSGKADEANQLFLKASQQTSYPQEFRELAELMSVYFAVQHAPEHTKDDAIIARLTALSADKKIWRYNAQELLAFYWFNSGDVEKAKQGFEALKNAQDVPASLRQRAEEMLAVIG